MATMPPSSSQSGNVFAVVDDQTESFIRELRSAFDASDRLNDGASLSSNGFTPNGSHHDHSMFELTAGTRIADFEIVREIGRGGMGVVYHAHQISLGRDVALKVLPNTGRFGAEAIARFRVEARAAARLHHTNIVSIYAEGQHEGLHYYAMELIQGVSLDHVIRECPNWITDRTLPLDFFDNALTCDFSTDNGSPLDEKSQRTLRDYQQIAAMMADVADALACAHNQGVIHRDIKPHNLLVDVDRKPHIVDFGLAQLADSPGMTHDGDLMGTLSYLSPEQVEARRGTVDHRTDIYSVGVTLYEIITGRKPFRGETRAQTIHAILNENPTPPHRIASHIPADLETICLRAMNKHPEERFASADELARDLCLFVDGRVIASRRPGPTERMIKWTRRHKLLSTLIVQSVVFVAVCGALIWAASTTKSNRRNELLQTAYERLAFVDYKRLDGLDAMLDEADELGGPDAESWTVRALANIGASNAETAIEQLQNALVDQPDELRVLYLLSWAQWKSGDRATSTQTFKQAEKIGPPTLPDEWFFRGLAIHYADPDVAVESYRNASILRARDQGFYAQAVLHLARARNQQMYAQRKLEHFGEAQSTLENLIEHQAYGAYPYYLLSIAHRLAAEIYSGSQGTRDDSVVAHHYSEALKWAREGQIVEPDNDRPVTAMAECLESMGRFDEAIDARTRAFNIATKQIAKWESLHYRWRLFYWQGDYSAALEDLKACTNYDPTNRFYEHVYPLLVKADAGDTEGALVHARSLADSNADDSMSIIWSAASLRLLGKLSEADDLLAKSRVQILESIRDSDDVAQQWPSALYSFLIGESSLGDLEALADTHPKPWKLLGEAYFHGGIMALAHGDRKSALSLLSRAIRSHDSEQRYTFHAKIIVQRLRDDESWPEWFNKQVGK